jgi:flagella basal body P-ring formation protein FlgA
MFNNPNGNRRQLTRRQRVRVAIALTILAWATQTLLAQWGFAGGPATAPSEQTAPPEKFVPGSARFDAGATIELRGEATVIGEEVRLRQLCRWEHADDAVLSPIGELVLARLGAGTPFRSISVEEIKSLLRDAGINIAAVNFVGATACMVNRSDVEYDQRTALNDWVAAREAANAALAASPTTAPSSQPADSVEPAVASAQEDPTAPDGSPVRSLRRLLIEDLCQRLSLPVESIQITFRPEDQKLLVMSEPLFSFRIEPLRARSLGEVSWQVQIFADGKSQRVNIAALARAWQNQLVLSRPIAVKQVFCNDDLIERRTLTDSLTDDPLVARSEVLGQQAARELKPGTVLTARMIDPVQLVRPGQYVTISLQQGTVVIKSVAKALEAGAYGQTIRVKNESTRDIFQVVLTGPQTATMHLPSTPQTRPPGASPANIATVRE